MLGCFHHDNSRVIIHLVPQPNRLVTRKIAFRVELIVYSLCLASS